MTISHLHSSFKSGNESNERKLCSNCNRPENACLCPYISQKRWCNCLVHLFVLVHPRCQTSTGTVQLLLPMFSHLQLIFGKRFIINSGDINDGDGDDVGMLPRELTDGQTYSQVFLLYPTTPEYQSKYAMNINHQNHQGPNLESQAKPIALVAIDGTWRHSKAILRNSPFLISLPRLDLLTHHDNVET